MIEFITNMAFMLTVVGVVIAAVMFNTFVVQKKSFKFWKKGEGEGATASAALGVFSIVGIAGLMTVIVFVIGAIFGSPKVQASSYSDMFKGITYFNGAYVFLGVDYTFKTSPQCVEGSADDNATSNLGFGGNIVRTKNRRHEVNAQYTHHSCVLGKDRNGYDGAGVEYKYWIFQR